MDDPILYTDPVTSVLKLMRSTFKDQMKAYYEGDPIDIPADNLPCVIVDEPKNQIRQDATQSDAFQTEVRIKIVMDKRDDFGKSDDIDLTERKLKNYIRGRNPQTGGYLPGTLMYALRTHITLGGTTLNTDVDVSYDLQPRPKGLITSEAKISVVASERIIRDSEATSI